MGRRSEKQRFLKQKSGCNAKNMRLDFSARNSGLASCSANLQQNSTTTHIYQPCECIKKHLFFRVTFFTNCFFRQPVGKGACAGQEHPRGYGGVNAGAGHGAVLSAHSDHSDSDRHVRGNRGKSWLLIMATALGCSSVYCLWCVL